MDLTKILSVLKTIFTLLKLFKRAKSEVEEIQDETQTNVTTPLEPKLQEGNGSAQSKSSKST